MKKISLYELIPHAANDVARDYSNHEPFSKLNPSATDEEKQNANSISTEKKKDKADAKERARVAKVEKKVKDEAFSEFLAVCTLEPNPTRERIQRDVVGAIDSIVTPKTKTSKQCAKEYESISS